MDWSDSWQIVLTAIASVGGASVIIVALSSWLGKLWAERLAIKQKAQMDKELAAYKKDLQMEVEKYRTKAEQFNFVNKLQFETEFKAYQLLFKYIYSADMYTRALFPTFDGFPEDKELKKQALIDRCNKQLNEIEPFYEAIEQNAPFINAEIYEKLLNIRRLINRVAITASLIKRTYLDSGNFGDLTQIYEYNNELEQAVKDISTDVRTYLSTLKVQE